MTDTTAQLLALFVNLAAFLVALAIYRRLPTPLLHPIIVSCVLVAATLYVFGIDYESYRKHSQLLYLLLGPAVVALAVPLKHHFKLVRRAAVPLTVTLLVTTLLSPLIAVLIALALGADEQALLALSAKSATTPIALALADEIGALQSLTAGIVVFSGVIGAVFGPPILTRLGITDPRVVGFALGLNAHAAGTARALELSALCGAFSGLAMGLCGTLTALLLPWALTMLS